MIYRIVFLLAFFSVAISFACSGQPMGSGAGLPGNKSGAISLQGAGATFPKPIYEKWASEYQKINPNVKINYQANGSGAGQKAILENTSDFGASDDPVTDEDLSGKDILHIPTVLGAVVLTYNLPDVKEPLKLSADTISEIYLGGIKKWNDAKIKADNPNVNLPDTDISPIYRADSSGTTAIFTEFLSGANAEWKEKVGANKQPNWITGVGSGAKGNDGVTGQVKNIPNSIGYIEIAFVKANDLPMALIKNKAGNFVEPATENVAAAASSMVSMPDDLRMKITNAAGDKSYPISSYTYILVREEQKDATKGKALVDFLWWAIHEGESFANDLHYARLPVDVVKKAEAQVASIKSNGKTLRQ